MRVPYRYAPSCDVMFLFTKTPPSGLLTIQGVGRVYRKHLPLWSQSIFVSLAQTGRMMQHVQRITTPTETRALGVSVIYSTGLDGEANIFLWPPIITSSLDRIRELLTTLRTIAFRVGS